MLKVDGLDRSEGAIPPESVVVIVVRCVLPTTEVRVETFLPVLHPVQSYCEIGLLLLALVERVGHPRHLRRESANQGLEFCDPPFLFGSD